MCWMTDSEPLAGCRSWIKEKWFGAWWMSPYHLIYSSSGGGRKCIMLFVSISWNRDNLWIISIRWKPTSVVKHFVFSKNIGTHTNRAFWSWSLKVSNTFQYYLSFICTKIWTDVSTLCRRNPGTKASKFLHFQHSTILTAWRFWPQPPLQPNNIICWGRCITEHILWIKIMV